MIGSRQIGADVLPAQLQDAERDWRAAARRATEASYRYHLVRVLGAAARRALVDERSQLRPPLWAVALRNWEGALDDGAARRAGMACFQASRDFHLASARRELLRARLAGTAAARRQTLAKSQHHLNSAHRAATRLAKALAPGA